MHYFLCVDLKRAQPSIAKYAMKLSEERNYHCLFPLIQKPILHDNETDGAA